MSIVDQPTRLRSRLCVSDELGRLYLCDNQNGPAHGVHFSCVGGEDSGLDSGDLWYCSDGCHEGTQPLSGSMYMPTEVMYSPNNINTTSIVIAPVYTHALFTKWNSGHNL